MKNIKDKLIFMMKVFKDFLNFIQKQGIVALAAAFILGQSITTVISSFVADIINPILGATLFGRIADLSRVYVNIGLAHITYGRFISTLINFIVVAAVVYFGMKKLGLYKADESKG